MPKGFPRRSASDFTHRLPSDKELEQPEQHEKPPSANDLISPTAQGLPSFDPSHTSKGLPGSQILKERRPAEQLRTGINTLYEELRRVLDEASDSQLERMETKTTITINLARLVSHILNGDISLDFAANLGVKITLKEATEAGLDQDMIEMLMELPDPKNPVISMESSGIVREKITVPRGQYAKLLGFAIRGVDPKIWIKRRARLDFEIID